MDNITYFVVLALAFAGAILWLRMITTLITNLARNHPDTYEALGSPPRLWEFQSPRGELSLGQHKATAALLMFVLRRDYAGLNDASLTTHCNRMRVLFVLFLVAFVALALMLYQEFGPSSSSATL